MRAQWFTVELLSDVVISARGATKGAHESLDYLPGSAFLGLAVSGFGRGFDPDLFWSGKVIFGDALPLAASDIPAFPMPLSYHLPKGTKVGAGATPLDGTGKLPPQTEQLRTGYLTPAGELVEVSRNSRMKTAIDREEMGRSAESQLFGYQSIDSGQRFAMCLRGADDIPAECFEGIAAGLEGVRRLGRSRSAEYGQVHITRLSRPPERPEPVVRGDWVVFYLITDTLLSSGGCPRLIPTPEDFFLDEGTLVPEASHIRTRSYSPWNSFYNSRMIERQVVCRGSVIVFRRPHPPDDAFLSSLSSRLPAGIGDAREEGLGQALVNPSFLFAPPPLVRPAPVARRREENAATPTPLAVHLLRVQNEKRIREDAKKLGLRWAEQWSSLHDLLIARGLRSPSRSQWGEVRELCLKAPDDLSQLGDMIRVFCGEGMRQRFWKAAVDRGGRESSMLDLVQQTIAGQPRAEVDDRQRALLVRRAIYFAAVQMSRAIQNRHSRHDDRGRR